MKYFIAVAAAALFFIYAHTAPPVMYFGDDGEVISAAATLGIGHPPGYPIYMFVTKIASLFPLGDISFRANLCAAALGVLVFVMFYICGALFLRLIFKDGGGRPAAAFGAVSMAVSQQIWFESVHSKGAVYLLMYLAVIISFYLILKYAESRRPKFFYAAFYSLGFMIPVHNSSAMYLLFAVPALVFIGWRRISPKKYLLSILLFLFALTTPYIYLFIRMKASPAINWGNLETYREVFGHIMRETYNYNNSKNSAFDAIAYRFGDYFSFYLQNYWLLGVFGLIGLYFIYKRSRILFACLTCFYAANLSALIYVINTSAGFPINDLSPLTLYASRNFYLSNDIMPVFFAMSGIFGTVSFLARRFTFDKKFAYGLAFFMPVLMILSNYDISDKSTEFLAYDNAQNILSSIPAGSILFTGNDCPLFNIAYLREVKKQFQDISVYDTGGTLLSYALYSHMKHKWDRDEFEEIEEDTIGANEGKVYETAIRSFKKYRGETNLYGILYKPGPVGEFYPDTGRLFDMYATRCVYAKQSPDIFYRSIADSYLVARARYAALEGNRVLAEKYISEASKGSVKSPGVYLNISLVYNLDLKDPVSAVPFVEKIIVENPYDLNAYGLLAKLYMQFDAEKAVQVLKSMYPRLSNDRERAAAIQEIDEISASIEQQKARMQGGVK